jgi:hypothetical protein
MKEIVFHRLVGRYFILLCVAREVCSLLSNAALAAQPQDWKGRKTARVHLCCRTPLSSPRHVTNEP